MGYVIERFDSNRREVHLTDDWSGTQHKILHVRDWNGYESDIEVEVEDTIA